MKRFIPLAAAALVAAALLFRPSAAPGGATARGSAAPVPGREAATGWSVAATGAEPKAKRTPVPSAVVYVAGAVRRAGVYTVPAGARVGDALTRAGGGRPEADLVAVNLAAHLRDGDEIVVPVLGADSSLRAAGGADGHGGHPKRGTRGKGVHGGADGNGARGDGARGNAARGNAATNARRGGRRPRRTDAPPPDSVDLNSADERALQTLPGVGPALAARIVLFREANGPFGSIDELLDVSGITERRLELISPYVEVR